MSEDERSEKRSLYEELEEAMTTYKTSKVTIALLRFLRELDMKAQVAFNRTVMNEKVINSLDESVFVMSEEAEGLKDKLVREFFNKPNFTNPIESSADYLAEQGLDSRRPDMEEDDDMWEHEIIFDDPYVQANFDDALEILYTINPKISAYRLFKLLTDK